MSTLYFPIGVLYQNTKLIYEIPKGIRENMIRIYSGFDQDEYDIETSVTEKQLTFHLSCLHTVVLERLRFGSIGWNIPYEFNPSDFAISKKQRAVIFRSRLSHTSSVSSTTVDVSQTAGIAVCSSLSCSASSVRT